MSWSDRNYSYDGPASMDNRPIVTYWLIGINIGLLILFWLFFGGGQGGIGLGGISYNGDIVGLLGAQRSELFGFQIWRWITYAFLHGDPRHLLFNMLTLYFLGRMLEGYFGHKRYLILYLSFGAVGLLGYAMAPLFTASPSMAPVIGASGCVMGLMALLGSRFPNMVIHLFGVIPLKCWVLAAFIVGMDLLNVLYSRGQGSNTAHSVHLAGAFAGFAYGFLWPRMEIKLAARKRVQVQHQKHQESERRVEDNLEMDRILQKINATGMDQLSTDEREFLLAQSQKLKSKKRF